MPGRARPRSRASRSTRSSRRRRCTGSPTTIGSGRGWPGRCDQVACSRSSAEERATSSESARSSRRSPATRSGASSAGRPGSSQGRRRQNGACGRRASPTTRCWLEERPTYPQDVDAFVPHVDPRGAPRAPAGGASASSSPPRSSRGCACRWTTCASTPPPAERLEAWAEIADSPGRGRKVIDAGTG